MLRGVISLAIGGAFLAGCAASLPDGPRFYAPTGNFGDLAPPVQTLQERKFLTVVRQRYDFSCGSAALATLLRYHYSEDARTEEDVFLGMWREGDRAQIRRAGFSLLDMKRYLGARGFNADGFRVPLETVAKTGVPGIALISIGGYRHFVVVKGVEPDAVLVGDPALGLRTMSRREFGRAWNGIYFAINDRAAAARSMFNGPQQWAAFARAPADSRFTGPVGLQELYLTQPLVLGGPLIRDF